MSRRAFGKNGRHPPAPLTALRPIDSMWDNSTVSIVSIGMPAAAKAAAYAA